MVTEKSDEFTCAMCGGTFRKEREVWSEEAARAELEIMDPGATVEECGIVCDPCYRTVMAWRGVGSA